MNIVALSAYHTVIRSYLRPIYPELQLGFFSEFSDIMIIGQNPGVSFNEFSADATKNMLAIDDYETYEFAYKHLIFSSKIGTFLRLSGINFTKISFTNIVRIPTPHNTEPSLHLVNVFLPILKRELEYIKPKLIIVMGNFARKIFNLELYLQTKFMSYNIIAIRHPSYYMRIGMAKDIYINDILKTNLLF